MLQRAGSERSERDALQPFRGERAVDLERLGRRTSDRDEPAHRSVAEAAAREGENRARARIEPVRIVDRHDDRLRRGEQPQRGHTPDRNGAQVARRVAELAPEKRDLERPRLRAGHAGEHAVEFARERIA